jgi:hypothetical protein
LGGVTDIEIKLQGIVEQFVGKKNSFIFNTPLSKSNELGEWVKKLQYIYTMDYHPVIKKNQIMSIAGKCRELRS